MKLPYSYTLPEYPEDVTAREILRSLEFRIAENFEVFPVDSRASYEEFRDCNGSITQIRNHSFVMGYYGSASYHTIAQLCEHVYRSIETTFRPGSLVMWRKRPEYLCEETDETCPHCDQFVRKQWKSAVRLRLGGWVMIGDHSTPDGIEMPYLNRKS